VRCHEHVTLNSLFFEETRTIIPGLIFVLNVLTSTTKKED
jgi:hypothetical protein